MDTLFMLLIRLKRLAKLYVEEYHSKWHFLLIAHTESDLYVQIINSDFISFSEACSIRLRRITLNEIQYYRRDEDAIKNAKRETGVGTL